MKYDPIMCMMVPDSVKKNRTNFLWRRRNK